jgi:Holliday junction resolvasome RuvABC endonuclease subunit
MKPVILALDLGTTTGIAMNGEGTLVGCYSQKWADKKEIAEWHKNRLSRRQDPRILRFFKALRHFKETVNPSIIVFEDVEFQSYTYQTQLWSSFRAAVWLAFPPPNYVVECVPTGTLKRFATGSGSASKEVMAKYLKSRYPQYWSENYDDNAVDALWLWLWAKENLSRITLNP